MRKNKSLILRLAALPIAAMPLTGCNAVVGDSVIWNAANAIKALMPDTIVDGNIGRGPNEPGFGNSTLRQGITDALPNVQPGEWLVAQEAGDHDVTAADVQWVVDAVPDDRCLAWVMPNNPARREAQAVSVENILDGLPEQPCHGFVRWDEVDTASLTTDGLHLNEAGTERMAQMISEVVLAD